VKVPIDIGRLDEHVARASVLPRTVPQCYDDVCITCSDEALPFRVVELLDFGLAMVDTGDGRTEEISVALVDASVGDVVLVHAKEAIAKVDQNALESRP
jgi:hydrogenase maturation factor